MNYLVLCVFSIIVTCGSSLGEETDCLPYATEYKALCLEDNYCEWMGDNAICKNKKCTCEDGYRWYKGRCQKTQGLGETCSSSDECYDGINYNSLVCNEDKKCECALNYIEQAEGICRLVSKKDGGCVFDEDCGSDKLSCSTKGKCEDTQSFDIKSNTTISEEDIMESCNSECKIKSKVSTKNKKDTDCGVNELAFHGQCVCAPGYFLLNGVCTGELGMYVGCEKDSDCPIKPGVCLNGACFCKSYWFHDEANQNCIKTITQFNDNCFSNEWCYALGPHSFCNTTLDDGEVNSKCQCNSLAKKDKHYYCERVTTETPDNFCSTDNDCKSQFQRCINEKCQCEENYHLKESINLCTPNINSTCGIVQGCDIENSECSSDCSSGQCQCKKNYIAVDYGETCYALATALNDSCEIDLQCRDLSNTLCSSNNTCQCRDGYVVRGETCYKYIGIEGYCASRKDCTIIWDETLTCRNNMCQCPLGKKFDGNTCKSIGTRNVVVSLSMIISFTYLLKMI